MIDVFIGYDPRQAVAANVLAHSIEQRASVMPRIHKLQLRLLPIKRKGLTEFTFGRYTVPLLCNYQGKAVFMDSDMLCLGDIAELVDLVDPKAAVSVVKNQLKFEWPSLMVFNNELCTQLTPEFIEMESPQKLEWGEVGELPKEWNHCVGYDDPNPNAKVVHFTQGIPCFPETKDSEFAKEWTQEFTRMIGTVPWIKIMGDSVHARPVFERLARAKAVN